MTGFVVNREGEPAKHVQAFMIQSILSNYSEMIQLTPVSRNDTSFLTQLFVDVVRNLENIGFEILCFTSDSNGINRKMFDSLVEPSQTYFISGNQNKIFTIYDAPHMMKCFRNNWLNSPDKIFKFPCLDDFLLKILILFQKKA